MEMLDRKAEKLARAAGVVPPEQPIRSVLWGELVVYREGGRVLPLAAYRREHILGYTEDRLFIVGQAKGLAVNLTLIDELQISSRGVVQCEITMSDNAKIEFTWRCTRGDPSALVDGARGARLERLRSSLEQLDISDPPTGVEPTPPPAQPTRQRRSTPKRRR